MNAKHTFLAVAATLALGVAHADSMQPRGYAGWVAHADSVFAAADSANLALASEIAARNAWVAHADAVFMAADAQNLANARSMDERNAWVAHADAVFRAADETNLAIARSHTRVASAK